MKQFNIADLLLPECVYDEKKNPLYLKINSTRPCNTFDNWHIKYNNKDNKYYVHGDITDGCCILKKDCESSYLEKIDGNYIVTIDNENIILQCPNKEFILLNNNSVSSIEDIELLLGGKIELKQL
jgi:hypothetical protein